ncbi:MAG: glutamate--cysteine ligase [Thiobacillaceae bacterium]|nr:glutamate--cysteine ligase [Thiobacillaceae bacterium]MDW8323862.1 glutamate--cysteine ligase [Burkholderiales bacterium]
MIPHLTTALTGPLLDLERHVIDAQAAIEHWLRQQWQEHAAPFYSSVDLRNAGYKLAPVDTNLFPGGFNNLNPAFLPLAVQAAQVAVEKLCANAQRLLIIPENHTRNLYYLQNVAALADILRKTGLNVRIGSLLDLTEPLLIDLPDGQVLKLEPVLREQGRLKLREAGDARFDPCAVLLNNDLSAGVPELLKDLDPDQTLIPPLHAGWATRRKSNHFRVYAELAVAFARLVGIDPWLIDPFFAVCADVDFMARRGEDCLAEQVSALLARIRTKYAEYGIDRPPFVIVKADAGTYGMGVMTVKDPGEVRELSRRARNKMAVVKEGLKVHQVLVQEGVYTFESIHGAVAEPVVYMIDHYVIGGFYRVHTARGDDENLNAPGMHFVPLAFEAVGNYADASERPDAPVNRFYTYGVLARLAALAAAIELEQTDPTLPAGDA